MAGSTPTARGRALGDRLKALREEQGLTVRALGAKLDVSSGTISRWEGGSRSPRPEDVARLLGMLDIGGEVFDELVELARRADEPQWLSVSGVVRSAHMTALLNFERQASQIVNVSPLLIPGLLQTADYARAIMAAGGVRESEIEQRVVMRVGRREVINKRNPAQLLSFCSEAALRQEIGGRDVMLNQLHHLLVMAEQPNIELRIWPLRATWSPLLEGPFVLLESGEAPPIVHTETRRGGVFWSDPSDVGAYTAAVESLQESAMSPAESAGLIKSVIQSEETTR